MVEINLLPWRETRKYWQTKLLQVSIVVLLGLMGICAIVYYSLSPSVIQTTAPVAAAPLPVQPPAPPLPTVGYFSTALHAWKFLQDPSGEIHPLRQTKLLPVTPGHFTLDLHQASLPQFLQTYGKLMRRNFIVSKRINGKINLHLVNVDQQQAFNLILTSQGLSEWEINNVTYIASFNELAKRKQAELKLQKVLQETEPVSTRTWQLKYAKAEDIVHLLQNSTDSLLSKRGLVRFDSRTNIVYAQDLPVNLARVYVFIQKLDIPVRQVLIRARLLSLDSDYERELGIDFNVLPAFGVGSPHMAIEGAPRYSLAVATLADGSLLDVTLSALEREGKGELISRPSLFTADQQTASIESGEEIPYQESSLNGATTVAFKKAVLSLQVTPQILPANKVLLRLRINQDRPSNRIILGVPAINTRQITTNVLVNNGQTIVLGGIYEMNKENGEHRIPFLGKIPLVGLLFTQQNARENKRELLIFVTPTIISQDGASYDQYKT